MFCEFDNVTIVSLVMLWWPNNDDV